MRSNKIRFITGFVSLLILYALLSCATQKAPLQIKNSLPQSELEYYSDSFDKMREDLWERAGYLWREDQVRNFKQADMRFDNGKLIIRTRTGSFSKGGLGSKYALRGDFDIQLNCQMDFVKGISGMDQVLTVGVYDKSLNTRKMSFAVIGLAMRDGLNRGVIFTNGLENGKWKKGNSQNTENFNGVFRIVRYGKIINTLYKKAGTAEWTKMQSFRVKVNDMIVGLQLRNFFRKRTTIQANHSISAEFDSLKINAAQDITEEEI